eukprot:2733685-Amphidinium_carterae.1
MQREARFTTEEIFTSEILIGDVITCSWRHNVIEIVTATTQIANVNTIDVDARSRYSTGCSVLGNISFKLWEHMSYEDGHHWFSGSSSAIVASLSRALEYSKVPAPHMADITSSMHDCLHPERHLAKKVALLTSKMGD